MRVRREGWETIAPACGKKPHHPTKTTRHVMFVLRGPRRGRRRRYASAVLLGGSDCSASTDLSLSWEMLSNDPVRKHRGEPVPPSATGFPSALFPTPPSLVPICSATSTFFEPVGCGASSTLMVPASISALGQRVVPWSAFSNWAVAQPKGRAIPDAAGGNKTGLRPKAGKTIVVPILQRLGSISPSAMISNIGVADRRIEHLADGFPDRRARNRGFFLELLGNEA